MTQAQDNRSDEFYAVERMPEKKFEGFSVLPIRYSLTKDTSHTALIFRTNGSDQFAHPVTYTTPWYTDLPGFNTLIGAQLARSGINVVAVSPEHPTITRSVRNIGSTSLRNDAYTQHRILNSVHKEGILDTSTVIGAGYSRGAMVGFGILATSASFGRQVPYTDATDPCLAKKVGIKDIPWAHAPNYVAHELGALATALIHHPPKNLGYIARNALPLSPSFLVQQVATGLALFSGEAGTFSKEWPEDTAAHVTLYAKSEFNHMYEWAKSLSVFPNIAVHIEDGHHLSGADRRVAEATVSRIVLAQRVLAWGGKSSDIARELTYPEHLKAVKL